ncbi:HNH endonuclease signature motif containing protein [Blastococcus sp. URHD0036]|uniref:HNH endonuclease signature motif containing protein n=1 Tax=Blastococcus sp. URHD0036 TaxID=1380356 RepID=UPI00068EFB4A|nr:HNH endonuclease signature motif containing protein [Blastococcus sp. URHD0036]
MSIGSVPRLVGVPVAVSPSEVVSARSADLELVADIWSTDAHMAREHAKQAAVIAELARRRRVSRDADSGPRGGAGQDAQAVRPAALADVSEDFVTELAVIRGCSDGEASKLAVEALVLTGKLAATWSELWCGRITIRKARILLDLLGDASDEVAAYVQAKVLPAAEECEPSRLADRARYHLYRADAEAKDRRRREAESRADIHVERTTEGMGQLVIDGPLPLVHAARDALGQHARWRRADGDARPIGVLRSTTAFDLILRPWDTSRPPVTAVLTVHAAIPSLRSDAAADAPPAELDGQVVTAAQCREVLADLDMLDLTAPPTGGSILIALDDPTTGQTVAVATRAELKRAAGTGRRIRRRGRTRPERDTADGPGLRLPPATPAYRHTAAQHRLVTTRDRHCRMPGCRRPPGRCDLDHVTAYADGGPTACENLCCLCRRHHRIKTFARGWAFTLLPDGRLVVRTPAGVTRTTRPPGWAHDPEPDPPWLDETAPPDPGRR